MRIRWLVAGWALASAVRPLSRRTGVPVTASPPSERSRAVFDWTWAFVLRPVAGGCRLIARSRGELSPSWLVVVRPLLGPTHLVMEHQDAARPQAAGRTGRHHRAPAPLHQSPQGGKDLRREPGRLGECPT